MSIEHWFSASYLEARHKFLAAARGVGAHVTTHAHPEKGPHGESLAMDAAYLGPRNAPKILITTSATHGIEGFCGSGVQVGLFEIDWLAEMPDDTALLQVHAHNPHGFAHERRVTEGNIDLNRNFVDFTRPLPTNAAYDEIQDLIVPRGWSGPARVSSDLAIAARVATRGLREFQRALTSGQYRHPDGLFFGGLAPTWSHRMIRSLAAAEVAGREHVAVIDLHTGLGPRGVGELIVDGGERDTNYRRARGWYGDSVKSTAKGESVSAAVVGTVETAYREAAGADRCTFVTLEFGTLPPLDVLQALRGDNWLYLHGDVTSDVGRRIKRKIRKAFYGEDHAWKEQVWTRTHEVVRMTLAGLTPL